MKARGKMVLWLSLFWFPCGAAAGPLGLALSSEVTVTGDTILLAHLMPQGAPEEWLRRAAQVSLGSAPEAGSVRELREEQLESALELGHFRNTDFILPERVEIRRPAADGARGRILAALQTAMASRGHAFPKGACRNELQIGEDVTDRGAGRLLVAGMTFDNGLGQARFLLRSLDHPKNPPFYVWCSPVGGAATESREPASRLREAASEEQAKPEPVLVDIHRAARLYLHSANSATTVSVRPLRPGHQGDSIPVRMPLHGTTFYARVVGQDTLEATF